MARQRKIQKPSQSRLFVIEDRAGPANAPEYQALARAAAFSWAQGDSTPVRVPSDERYGDFDVVERIRGQAGLPQITLEYRMTRDLSDMLRLVRKGCPLDIQLHIGACQDPTDFLSYEKVHILEGAEASDYGTSDLGALDADQDDPVTETISFTGLDYYEVKPLIANEIGEAEIVQEIISVSICDSVSCGECGLPSDGCQKVFAVTLSAGGSPGLPAEVIYSGDSGSTLLQTNISTLAANHDPSDATCVGPYFVVVSEDNEALHYAEITDFVNGLPVTWTKVTTGFVANKGPRAMWSVGRTFTWIAGAAGYIYFSSDVTAGVTVQSAGSITAQDLNDVHALDDMNVLIVGNLNVVLYTTNGGATWASVTGPAAGVNLNCCWMKSETEWFVGSAAGNLYYTRDSGTSWTTKAFSGSAAGQVRDIVFATASVGYMAHSTATPAGRIFRTIDGGYSWDAVPEAAGLSLPANDYIGALAACEEDPNLVWGGGLDDNAIDGILIKAA